MKAAADAKLAKPLANLVINDITARMNADESFNPGGFAAHARSCS